MPRGRHSLVNSRAKRKKLADSSSKSTRPIRVRHVAPVDIGKRCPWISASSLVRAVMLILIETSMLRRTFVLWDYTAWAWPEKPPALAVGSSHKKRVYADCLVDGLCA